MSFRSSGLIENSGRFDRAAMERPFSGFASPSLAPACHFRRHQRRRHQRRRQRHRRQRHRQRHSGGQTGEGLHRQAHGGADHRRGDVPGGILHHAPPTGDRDRGRKDGRNLLRAGRPAPS